MKILWITNIPLPPICEAMGHKPEPVGGWMYSSLTDIKHTGNLEIAVATVYPGNELIKRYIDGVTYWMLPLKGEKKQQYNRHLELYWSKIDNDFRPDVVHIHGSEFPHGLAYVRAVGAKGVVVSIQGIISCIARYYTAGIDSDEIKNLVTLRDIIKQSSIKRAQRSFERRGILERELICSVNHLIGRTEWDKTHSWALNPNAKYYFCGETLRNSFYNHKWCYKNCEKHSIFVSQASYPIKGLHMLLKALPIVKRRYEGVKVYVAGFSTINRPSYLMTQYDLYLKTLVEKYNLSGNVEYTGLLNEEQICNRYLKSNLFVCCSAIENSPNSLGEAQMLGMPYVASYVGGVPEIVNHNPNVLYRFEEYENLAKKICEIFAEEDKIEIPDCDLSRYNREKNSNDLIRVYKSISLGEL